MDRKLEAMGKIWSLALFACGICLMGCNKAASSSGSAESSLGPDHVNVSAVRQSFQTADSSLQFTLEDQLRLIGAGAYSDALPGLKKLVENRKTTAEQKKALEDVIQKLQALTPGSAAH